MSSSQGHKWNPVFRDDRNEWFCSKCKIVVFECVEKSLTSSYRVGPQGPPDQESFYVLSPEAAKSKTRVHPGNIKDALQSGVVRKFDSCDVEIVKKIHEA